MGSLNRVIVDSNGNKQLQTFVQTNNSEEMMKEYIRNQNELSDMESVSSFEESGKKFTAQYDGVITLIVGVGNGSSVVFEVYLNDTKKYEIRVSSHGSEKAINNSVTTINLKKQDTIYIHKKSQYGGYGYYCQYFGQWYKLRDYSDR